MNYVETSSPPAGCRLPPSADLVRGDRLVIERERDVEDGDVALHG